MSSRTRPASAPSAPAAGPAGKNVWMAVALGVLLGQVGYLYTRQGRRFVVSMVLGAAALVVAGLVAWVRMPPLVIDEMTDPMALTQQITAAMGLPTAVALLNNLVCAVDLFIQVNAANQR